MPTRNYEKNKGGYQKRNQNQQQSDDRLKVGPAWVNGENTDPDDVRAAMADGYIRVNVDEEVTLNPDMRVFLYPNRKKEPGTRVPDFDLIAFI